MPRPVASAPKPAPATSAGAVPKAAPAPAVKPVANAAPQRPPAASSKTASGGLSDERVAQLHAELNAARRQLNQASAVSIDSLAKSLRETESKLKSQHGGRAVDFQVVIKDGKPIVKPVVRR
ncbi:MAG TPA: MXAN_5187 C-terminal domain-containing protein [Polyangiaceae bacterium]|nr:MXAN_5187 C-terminal domain-containing protein [Polyangiaceae bacterium]